MEVDKPYAPTFVLYCLTAAVASVVDKKLAMQTREGRRPRLRWLKTSYAGSGPFKLRDWKANEVVVLERNPDTRRGAPLAA